MGGAVYVCHAIGPGTRRALRPLSSLDTCASNGTRARICQSGTGRNAGAPTRPETVGALSQGFSVWRAKLARAPPALGSKTPAVVRSGANDVSSTDLRLRRDRGVRVTRPRIRRE